MRWASADTPAASSHRPPDLVRASVRPGAYLARSVPPLISQEEALRLGEIEDHAEIEALVERAWQARRDRFGDSTDMCSVVNAKSGGCAEDCGFCAQSRYAEADTPMHAMMTPEQILEHARAGEVAARGRHPARAPQRRDRGELLPGGLDHRPLRGPAAHHRRRARGGPRDVRRRHPQPGRVARAACGD